MTDEEPQLVMIDGTDALAAILILRGPEDRPGSVRIEAHARHIGKRAAANVLRQIADKWEKEAEAKEKKAESS